jgi:hemolysin D
MTPTPTGAGAASVMQSFADAIDPDNRPPAGGARMVSLGLCVMAAMALVYASLARIDVVVSAQGRVIPSGKSKVIQPLEPGVVRAIAVRDGQRVKAGEVLIELDPTSTAADSDRLQRDAWEAQGDALRVRALLAGKNRFATPEGMPLEISANQQSLLQSRLSEHRSRMAATDADIARKQADRDAIEASLAQMRQSLPLVTKKHAMREDLAKTGHIAETGLIETRLELINMEKELAVQGNRLNEAQASLNASVQQKAQALAEFQLRANMDVSEAARRHGSTQQELIKANQRRELQTLRSPIDGVVQQLAVTTVGGVVTAAQPLMTIVPQDSVLEVDAQVLNRDIGQIRVGQRVINKAETFDFTRYGYIEGAVLWVGTDAVQDPKLGPVYPVRIRLDASETPNMAYGRKGVLSAGMSVTADVRTGERRLIEYFLAPMLRYKEESLRER